MKLTPQSAGGKARAIKSRIEAIENYNKNPKYCAFCSKKIEIIIKKGKIYNPKLNKFCNKDCYNNFQIGKTFVPKRHCICGQEISKKNIRLTCNSCDNKEKLNISLKDLRNKYGTFQFHAKIRGSARAVYKKLKKTKKCFCGYDLYIEIAHIKPIKDFDENTLLSEVNHPNNLIALCRNHHWEFDHGLIKLDKSQLTQKVSGESHKLLTQGAVP